MALGHHDDALVVAERGRTRAFVDLLLERQLAGGSDNWYDSLDSSPVTLEQILRHVRHQRATVVYYSLAAGYLYSWVISPKHGKGTSQNVVRDHIYDMLCSGITMLKQYNILSLVITKSHWCNIGQVFKCCISFSIVQSFEPFNVIALYKLNIIIIIMQWVWEGCQIS